MISGMTRGMSMIITTPTAVISNTTAHTLDQFMTDLKESRVQNMTLNHAMTGRKNASPKRESIPKNGLQFLLSKQGSLLSVLMTTSHLIPKCRYRPLANLVEEVMINLEINHLHLPYTATETVPHRNTLTAHRK